MTESSVRYYRDGRIIYLQEKSGTVAVKNHVKGESTAFQPENWNSYIADLSTRTLPY